MVEAAESFKKRKVFNEVATAFEAALQIGEWKEMIVYLIGLFIGIADFFIKIWRSEVWAYILIQVMKALNGQETVRFLLTKQA